MVLMNLGQIKWQVPIVIINKELLLSDCVSCETLQRSVLQPLTVNDFICVLKESQVPVMKFVVKMQN